MKTPLLLGLLTASFLNAGEFSPQDISRDAQWYLHANVEKLRETTTGKTLIGVLKKDHGQKLRDAELLFGFDLIEDISDISLFGNGKEDHAAILIKGDIGRKHLEDIIIDADQYQTKLYQNETIHSWNDDGKTQNAAFHGESLVIMSQQEELVTLTLDVLSGRKPHLESTPPFPNGPLMIGTAHIAGLELPVDDGSKMIKKAKTMSAAISETGDRLHADLLIETNVAKTAARLQKIAEGLMAFGLMAEPELEDLDLTHASAVSGNTVTMNLTIPVQEALALLAKMP